MAVSLWAASKPWWKMPNIRAVGDSHREVSCALVLFQNQRHHHSFVRHGKPRRWTNYVYLAGRDWSIGQKDSQGINEAAEAAVVDSCNRILTCSQRNVFFQWRFLHVRILEFPLKQQQQHRWWKSTMKKRSPCSLWSTNWGKPEAAEVVKISSLRWVSAFCWKYILKHAGKIWDLFILGPIFQVVFKCI